MSRPITHELAFLGREEVESDRRNFAIQDSRELPIATDWRRPNYDRLINTDDHPKHLVGSEFEVAILLAGISREMRHEMSFLGYADPGACSSRWSLHAYQDEFKNVFHRFFHSTEDGSRAAALTGGAYYNDKNLSQRYCQGYPQTVKATADMIRTSLEIEPVVLTGPKLEARGNTDLFYDTAHRHALIRQTPQLARSAYSSFPASEIYDQTWISASQRYPRKAGKALRNFGKKWFVDAFVDAFASK